MNNNLKKRINSNEIVVNNKSNFKSQLVKCQTIMDNTKFDELILKGMGKATTRALNLALQLNSNNHNTFELKSSTYSVDVPGDRPKIIRGAERDNFDPDEIIIEAATITHVPAIEIVVRKNKLELNKIKKAIKKT